MKRSEISRRSGVGRGREPPPAADAGLRAFVHDVVNPIAAIRISLDALRARAALTEREMADVRRIEEAAGMIVRLVTNLAPAPRALRRASVRPVARRTVDLYLLCCELADARRFAAGTIIHCRAFGDPRGDWDRRQVTRLVSGLLDHALAHLGRNAPLAVSVTGMARHVRVDVHGLGWLSPAKRKTALDVSSNIGPAPPGTTVSAIAAPNHGIVFRLRLPRWNLAPRDQVASARKRGKHLSQ